MRIYDEIHNDVYLYKDPRIQISLEVAPKDPQYYEIEYLVQVYALRDGEFKLIMTATFEEWHIAYDTFRRMVREEVPIATYPPDPVGQPKPVKSDSKYDDLPF